ncbi:hypothetical protein [Nocardiopsis ansamitocini]|uniref:Uncharacterized protein n=1 Tax=Nocardiopsis ansamitocini TaxID=1670832 RepID=A0A9W6P9X9_9ACTN|nr:hypothetical protein [Nocardiopsis ansamitocini]GLU49845.1 hypothetical protein Nans01_41960 [Nocardiopsis ansamitocini]
MSILISLAALVVVVAVVVWLWPESTTDRDTIRAIAKRRKETRR